MAMTRKRTVFAERLLRVAVGVVDLVGGAPVEVAAEALGARAELGVR